MLSEGSERTPGREATPAEARPDRAPRDGPMGQGLVAAGGMLGAVAASSCCIVPVVLFSLGATGAWIGNLTALAPYQPVFVTVTAGFLGTGFYMVYRKPKAATADVAPCALPIRNRIVKTALWSAVALTAAALAFPYAAPMILGV